MREMNVMEDWGRDRVIGALEQMRVYQHGMMERGEGWRRERRDGVIKVGALHRANACVSVGKEEEG